MPTNSNTFGAASGGAGGLALYGFITHHFARDPYVQVTVADEFERQLVILIAALYLESFPTRVFWTEGGTRLHIACQP